MEKTIEQCAQRIVEVLKRNREANILRLSEQVAERSIVIYQALGWLLRGGAIRYETRGNQIYVTLGPEPSTGG